MMNADLRVYRDEVARSTRRITDIQRARSQMDIDALARGELTGDLRMDAALLLSFLGRDDKWLETTKIIYDLIREEEAKLAEWDGGPVVYDATGQYSSPYCGELVFGDIENPHLTIEFNGADPRKDHRPSVAMKVGPFYFADEIRCGTVGWEDLDQDSLDITGLFHPNSGPGRLEIGRRLAILEGSHVWDKQLGGLYLGADAVRQHAADINEYLAPQNDRRYASEYRSFMGELNGFTEQFLARPQSATAQ